MTPAARVAAAIEVLDDILAGTAPEKALTGWGRSHRFAGSKDRAAIRDHVFQALRCRASYAWIGGAKTGRGIMLGAMRALGLADTMFNGEGHAPKPVTIDEAGASLDDAPRAIRLDIPDWLLPHFDSSLGEDADRVLDLLKDRAGVFLRVNVAKTSRDNAQDALASEGIVAVPIPDIKTALHVIENERRVAHSKPYLEGWVELQDTSSQRAVDCLAITDRLRVLDMCAGGGGKALAMAALGADVSAHDIDLRRMVDLPARAARAGVSIDLVETEDLPNCAPFDLVLCDAPCSGSGTWRRTPAAKWDLTAERLSELTAIQDDVLSKAAPLVANHGRLAYATCSVFGVENSERVDRFLAQCPEFEPLSTLSIQPHALGDGFFLSVMGRRS